MLLPRLSPVAPGGHAARLAARRAFVANRELRTTSLCRSLLVALFDLKPYLVRGQ